MGFVTLDEYNQKSGKGTDYSDIAQGRQDPEYSGYGMYAADDGSVMDTIGSKFSVLKADFINKYASEEHSQFAQRNVQRKIEEAKAEEAKLGMAGQLVAGAAPLAPIIAAGLVNPALGAATATGIYSADIAAQQAMKTGRSDYQSSLGYGTLTGAADLATGGVAGRFRAALPAAAPLAKRVGINVAEDATGAMAGQAFTNMATGEDWNEGLGTAAVMGSAAGGAVRGGLHGYNKARGTASNMFGENAIKDIHTLKKDIGITPTENFVNESYAFNNQAGQKMNDIVNARNVEERDANIDAFVNMSAQGAGRAADLDAMSLAKEYKIPFLDTSFDISVPTGLSRKSGEYRLADEMDISDKEIFVAGEGAAYAHVSRFGRKKAVKEGSSKEADEAEFKTTFDKAMGDIKGRFMDNNGIIDRMIDVESRQPNVDKSYMKRLTSLQTDAYSLNTMMDQYVNQGLDVSTNIEIAAGRMMREASDLGILQELTGISGKPGSFSPIKDIMTIDRLSKMAKARMPNVTHASPNKFKNSMLGTGGMGTAVDVGLVASGMGGLAMLRRGVATAAEEGIAKRSRTKLKNLKSKTMGRLEAAERAVEARKQQAMAEGDTGTAADIAAAQLTDGGIDVPPTRGNAGGESIVDQSLADSASKSSPLIPKEPGPWQKPESTVREDAAQADIEAQAALQAQQMAEAEAVARSEPVPAATPTRPTPTPEVAPQTDPAMMSRSMAAQPELTPEARKAQLAAALQERILEQQAAKAAPEPEPTTAAEWEAQQKADWDAREAGIEASRTPSSELSGKPKQPQAPEPKAAPEPVQDAPKRTSSKDLATRPLERDKSFYENMSSNDKTNMLRTDPERLKDLRNADADLTKTNTIIDTMAHQNKMSPGVAATYLNEMGGLRGIRDSIKEQNLDLTPEQFVTRRIKELEREKAAQVKEKLNKPKQEAEKVVQKMEDENVKADEAVVIADKHIKTREELNSLGYDKSTIDEAFSNTKATDTTKDFDPKIVKNWAKTLSKQVADEAKEAVAEATAKAKELSQRATALAKKVMDDGERSRIENDLRDQIDAHKGVVSKKGVDGAAKARSREQMQNLQRKLDEVSETQNKARKEAQEAQKKAQDAASVNEERVREFEKIQKKNQARMEKLKETAKDVERLNTQKDAIRDAMKAEGANEAEIEKYLVNQFPFQDRSLGNSQFVAARDKGLAQVKKRKDAETKAASEKLKEELEAMDDAEIEIVAKDLLGMKTKVADYSSPETQAMLETVIKQLADRGQTFESGYMKLFAGIVAKGEVRKKQFPNDRKQWVSHDDKASLQRMMSQKEGGSWMGNLQKQLSAHFFGDSNLGSKYFTRPESEIQNIAETGDSDIVAKPKKDFKKIARKVNKSQK
ncbi:MAG: hypothetical protein ACRC6V_05820 [Bacteroidales bacterium]